MLQDEYDKLKTQIAMLNYYFDKDDSVGKFLKLIFINKDKNVKLKLLKDALIVTNDISII